MSTLDNKILPTSQENFSSDNIERIFAELLTYLTDPYQKRLVETYMHNYASDNAVTALEDEFGKILLEQLDDED